MPAILEWRCSVLFLRSSPALGLEWLSFFFLLVEAKEARISFHEVANGEAFSGVFQVDFAEIKCFTTSSEFNPRC